MIALTANKFGRLPSELLEIRDSAIAFDFDHLAAFKLQLWEDERTAAMWGGSDKTEVRFDGSKS